MTAATTPARKGLRAQVRACYVEVNGTIPLLSNTQLQVNSARDLQLEIDLLSQTINLLQSTLNRRHSWRDHREWSPILRAETPPVWLERWAIKDFRV